MYKTTILVGLAILSPQGLAAVITPTNDPLSLASELLSGSEVKKTIGDGQIGTFENLVLRGANNTQLVLDRGVVLSSGYLAGLPMSNASTSYGSDTGGNGDALIDAFPIDYFNRGGKLSNDAAVIRLRFNAPNNVNGVMARFVYASEEFPEFSGSQYADGFAFARSETVNGVKQDTNYAILPNGNPVSLLSQHDNIHFMANDNSTVADIEFDGLTRILTVKAPVTAGATEDFSLVIADTGDHVYDSTVFVSALSFFNDPGFDFSVGSVTIEDNPASNGFQEFTLVPLPSSAWFLISGISTMFVCFGRRRA
ncbi:MAG: choice-of-anchor L domain-containing protein [Gammaproteobacteria bacterium]